MTARAAAEVMLAQSERVKNFWGSRIIRFAPDTAIRDYATCWRSHVLFLERDSRKFVSLILQRGTRRRLQATSSATTANDAGSGTAGTSRYARLKPVASVPLATIHPLLLMSLALRRLMLLPGTSIVSSAIALPGNVAMNA